MSLLDEKYGAGASTAFAESVDFSTVIPNSTNVVREGARADGGISISVTWFVGAEEVGILYLVAYPDRVFYPGLEIRTAAQKKGALERLANRHKALFKKGGIPRMVCQPGGPASETALKAVGFQWEEWQGHQWLVILTGA